MKHTKGPWLISKNGDISGENHPICSVEYGEWGDSFPTLRLEGLSLERKCFPTMEMIVYGEIPEEESKANSHLISAAPEMLELIELVYKSFGGGNVITFSDRDIEQFQSVILKATGEN